MWHEWPTADSLFLKIGLLEICATLAVNKSNDLVALLQPYQPLCQYPLGPPKYGALFLAPPMQSTDSYL